MSQENVEIVRAAYGAWNAGDMDAFRDCYDPDVILRPPSIWPEPGPFVGREAVMRLFEQARDVWDADTLEPIGDFIDAADRVVVRYAWHGAGRGPESNMEMTNVVTVRRRRIFYQEIFQDHAEALEAAGLSEQVTDDVVELHHRAVDTFNRRDIDGSLAVTDDEVEFVPRAVGMEGASHYRGHDGVRRWWNDLLDVFPDFTIELGEVRDMGDMTLATARLRGHGAGSDTPTEETTWQVARWRRGKCVWWQTFSTRDEALEATGLPQQDARPNS